MSSGNIKEFTAVIDEVNQEEKTTGKVDNTPCLFGDELMRSTTTLKRVRERDNADASTKKHKGEVDEAGDSINESKISQLTKEKEDLERRTQELKTEFSELKNEFDKNIMQLYDSGFMNALSTLFNKALKLDDCQSKLEADTQPVDVSAKEKDGTIAKLPCVKNAELKKKLNSMNGASKGDNSKIQAMETNSNPTSCTRTMPGEEVEANIKYENTY